MKKKKNQYWQKNYNFRYWNECTTGPPEGLHFNYQTALREVTEIKITTQGVTAQGVKEQ